MAYQNLGESNFQLPVDFNLVQKASAPSCTSRRVNVLPLSGGSFNPGDVAKFEVPCGINGQYVDTTQTYLLIKVTNKDPAFYNMFVDGNAACFIQKLEVYSSSMLIETIAGYNALFSALENSQLGPLDRQGFLSITHGTDVDAAEDTVNFTRSGMNMLYGQTYTFCIPLVSGVIGTGLSKMLPVGMLTDLRVELTFENNANAVVSATTTSVATPCWGITAAELVLQVLTLNSEVNEMVASHREPVIISSESFRNYNTVLNAANTGDNTIIPLKFTSVKSLINVYRLQNNQNTFNVATITSRRNPFASSGATVPNIQWLLGNVYAPAVPLRSTPEIFSEFQKSLHTLSNTNNKSTLNKQTYDNSSEPATTISAQAVTGIAQGTGVITITSTNGYVVGQPIWFFNPTNAVIAGNVYVAGTSAIVAQTYYISSIITAATFTIAVTPYGFPAIITQGAAVGAGLTCVTTTNYCQQTPSFVMGLNLDTMYQSSTTCMSGINSNAGNVFMNTIYSAATPAGGQRLDIWAHYDHLLIIDPQTKQMSVRI